MSQYRVRFKTGQVYHIWSHANGSENLFREDMTYHYFLDRYFNYLHPIAETFAYCLLPNHFHFMIRIREESEILSYLKKIKVDTTIQGFEKIGGFSNVISRQFSNFLNGYTQFYNNKYDRMGSLFIPNFRRKLIDSDEYFTRLIIYIHNNPIHHGLVKNLNEWPHNSWHIYNYQWKTKLNIDEGLRWFGSKELFLRSHQTVSSEILIDVFE